MELEGLKERARQIVRRSRDPARCLQLMRAKAAAFLESGGLGTACREIIPEKERGSDSGPRYADELGTVPAAIMLPPFKEEVSAEVYCKSGMMRLTPVSMVDGLFKFQTVRCLKAFVPRVQAAESMVCNPFPARRCVFETLVRAMLDVHVFSWRGSFVRTDDEPPDPGLPGTCANTSILLCTMSSVVEEMRGAVGQGNLGKKDWGEKEARGKKYERGEKTSSKFGERVVSHVYGVLSEQPCEEQ